MSFLRGEVQGGTNWLFWILSPKFGGEIFFLTQLFIALEHGNKLAQSNFFVCSKKISGTDMEIQKSGPTMSFDCSIYANCKGTAFTNDNFLRVYIYATAIN